MMLQRACAADFFFSPSFSASLLRGVRKMPIPHKTRTWRSRAFCSMSTLVTILPLPRC